MWLHIVDHTTTWSLVTHLACTYNCTCYIQSIDHWFASINYVVHTVMYSYHAIKSAGLYTYLHKLHILLKCYRCPMTYSLILLCFKEVLFKVDHAVIYMGFVIYESYALCSFTIINTSNQK